MSLNFGPTLLAIPGPSIMPERVLRAMHRASPNIYEGELIDLTDTLFPDLQTVAQTKNDVAIYIANGHGAWEAAIKNTLVAGDKVLVLSTGRFAIGWAELADTHGIDVQLLDFGMQGDADPAQVEAALRADTKGEIKALLTVQTDTSSSVINDIPMLREAINNAGHDCLFMVDCIASLGCDRFEMDAWGVDVMVAACQKGLMTPAGLAFVYYNEKGEEARKRAKPGYYWDWIPRTRGDMFYQQFAGTAPTHHLFGLREALDILVHEEGIENVWARHKTIATAYWAAVDAWGEGGEMHHNIPTKEKRSTAVSTIATGTGDAKRLRQWTEHKAGMTLGIGLGFGEVDSDDYDRHFRIGHMGHQNVPMAMGVIGAIECGLKALNIPHGEGAASAAAAVIAAVG
ncbi:MAG: aminotransferase class V-fold PLP-dependent enzyme [Rhizobiaceae bacterium]